MRVFFGDLYWTTAATGAIIGIRVSHLWGGLKSTFGRAAALMVLGLLGQVFGQITYSVYSHLTSITMPYPSIGDIGFFGSIFAYIYAMILMGRVTGLSYALRNRAMKIFSLLLIGSLLLVTYAIFLTGYELDWSQPLKVMLDFGYPLGQSIYLAIALLAMIGAKKYLGGVMKKGVVLVFIALCAQYVADFVFLFKTSRNIWVESGVSEILYLFAYFMLTLALMEISKVVAPKGAKSTS